MKKRLLRELLKTIEEQEKLKEEPKKKGKK